jgi:prophage regulatory protein
LAGNSPIYLLPSILIEPLITTPKGVKKMAQNVMRLPEVKTATGLSRSSIYAFSKRGEFPAPIPLGARAVGWLSNEIDYWILNRISARAAFWEEK